MGRYPPAVSWVWIALTSVLSGMLGAMGMGGGGILLLALVSFGMEQLTAQGVNLLMILPVGLLGLFFHRKNGLTEKSAALPMLWGGIPGVALGFWLAGQLQTETLRLCFGILIILLGLRELWIGCCVIRREGWQLMAKGPTKPPRA